MEDAAHDSPDVSRARQLGGRNLPYASSVLFPPDILIDFFSDCQLRRLGVETDAIRHLLITHGHADHFQPQAILVFAVSLPQPLGLYGNGMVQHALKFAATHQFDEASGRVSLKESTAGIRFHPVEAAVSRDIGGARVTPVLSNHCIDKTGCSRSSVASHISLAHVAPYDDIVEELASTGIALAYDGMAVEL